MALFDDTRADWGASRPSGTINTVSWSVKTEIFWHYIDGTPRGLASKAHSACLALVKDFQTFHMGPSRGWNDLGYNGLICQHGRAIEGRGLLTVGAHCPNHNRQGIGIQFMVGGNESPTPAAYARAVQFVADAKRASGHSFRIMGHRDGIATSCPGDVIYSWMKSGMPTTPQKEPTVLTEYLVRGDTGPQVTLLQKILNAVRGAKLTVDGSFGPAVETAVKGYQTSRKLTADGKVGPATRESLNAAWAAYNAPKPPPVVVTPPPPPPAPAPTIADVLTVLKAVAADVAAIKANTTPKEPTP